MKTLLSAILVFVLAGEVLPQIYPVINESRPRIIVPQQRFNWLDSNINLPQVAPIYTEFRYRYDNWWLPTPDFYLVGEDSTQWTYKIRYFTESESGYAQDMLYNAVFSAFLWKFKHEPVMLKRIRFVVSKFNIAVDTSNFNTLPSTSKEAVLRAFGNLGSTLLDWCYGDLPDDLKAHLSQSLYKINSSFMSNYLWNASGNSYVSSHNAYNCVLTMQNVMALHNAYGLMPHQQDSVTAWYHLIYDKWINGFFPIYSYYRSTTGGWNWGAAYSFWSLIDQFLLFDYFLFGTNKNFYTDLPYVYNSINQYFYFARPDNRCIHLGDGETLITNDNAIFRHSAYYNDTRSNYLSQKYSSTQFLTGTIKYFNQLAFRNFLTPATQHPDLPLNWFSDKVGLSVSRTSWDSNSVMIWFFNSPSKKASHEHRDNNTFEIFYKKPLLVESGYYDTYGGTHFKNYYTRTVAHNVVTVFDPNETMYHGGEIVSNDGGQIFSNPLQSYSDIFSPAFQRGKWLTYSAGNNFSYSAGDASLSYSAVKLKRYYRKLLYIKPFTVLVLDNIILQPSASPGREVRWNGHSQTTPQITGQFLQSEIPGHIETFKNQSIYIQNGNGNISIKTLSPDSTKVKRIGGAGYEYYVNGTNYPPLVQPDTNTFTNGKWRVEIIPYSISDTINFLNVITIGNNTTPSLPTGTKILSQYSLGADLGNCISLFSRTGDTSAIRHFADSITGNRTLKLYAFDLKRSRNFKLYIDNIFIRAINSDTSGIAIDSLTLATGNHSISLMLDTLTNIKKEESNLPLKTELYNSYPNPFNSISNIKFQIVNSGNVEITLFDLLGREVKTLVNENLQPGTYKVSFDVEGLKSGIYFCKLNTKGYSKIIKLVLIK